MPVNSPLGFIPPELLTDCTVHNCSVYTSFYNYRISLAANVVFVVLFALALVAYSVIWLVTRRAHFFNTVMLMGLIVEVLGYSARIWAYYDQWNETAFVMQFACTTLAPAFFSAAIYVCLAYIVIVYGRENSKVKPLWYTFIFVPCDAVALILQAVGGGLGSTALAELNLELFNESIPIITSGLAFQVFTLLCFLILCIWFGLRVRRRRRKLGDEVALSQEPLAIAARESHLFPGFLFALAGATTLILWRCVYRLVELNDGFDGPVTFDQGLFIGFEGALMVATVWLLAIMHPAICLGKIMKI